MRCPYAKNGHWCVHKGSESGYRNHKVTCKFKDEVLNCPVLKESESKAVLLQILEESVPEQPEGTLETPREEVCG